MLPSVRFVRVAVLGSVLIAIVVSMVLAGHSPSSPQSPSSLFGGDTTQTRWGPLSSSDRDMLIKIRQADLWEGPAGQLAAGRAGSPAVREVGGRMAAENAQLDAQLLAVAGQLRLPMPEQPSDQQRVWLSEITDEAPAGFDARFVNLVRSAYGEVMPLVEGVRSGTRNELVRQFAIEAGDVTARHMDYLESTGLVDYTLFPPSTAPAARLASIGGVNVPVTLLLFLAAVLVGAALLRGLGGRRGGRRAERFGWWARAAIGARGAAGAARTRVLRSARERREFKERMVTTAELIAVLRPDAAPPVTAEQGRRRAAADALTRTGGIPTRRPAPPVTGPGRADRHPPKLGRRRRGRGW